MSLGHVQSAPLQERGRLPPFQSRLSELDPPKGRLVLGSNPNCENRCSGTPGGLPVSSKGKAGEIWALVTRRPERAYREASWASRKGRAARLGRWAVREEAFRHSRRSSSELEEEGRWNDESTSGSPQRAYREVSWGRRKERAARLGKRAVRVPQPQVFSK